MILRFVLIDNMQKINLLDFSYAKMRQFFQEIGEQSFRAEQVFKWIHQLGVDDFEQMTNLSLNLRSKLQKIACIKPLEIISSSKATDGTMKWLLRLSCNNAIETVYIPEKARGTLCVSSQVGCALDCSFCSTGKQGFNRNLSVAEIIGQVWVAVRELSTDNKKHDRHITNVVMMGMGEPLLNFENVIEAMDIMLDDCAYGLSKMRVTLSTSGILPQMEKLKAISPVSLAVSLHAPNDQLRNILVPVNKKYPLKDLMKVCKNYFENEPKRKITFEYVMLKDVNDSIAHARELAQLLANIPAKVNLIPFNPFPRTIYERSSEEQINKFRDVLIKKGINTITRKTRGDNINAACGQLAGEFQDRTSRSLRHIKRWEAQADLK